MGPREEGDRVQQQGLCVLRAGDRDEGVPATLFHNNGEEDKH